MGYHDTPQHTFEGRKLTHYSSSNLVSILQNQYIEISLAESAGGIDKSVKLEQENIYIWEEISRRLEMLNRLILD